MPHSDSTSTLPELPGEMPNSSCRSLPSRKQETTRDWTFPSRYARLQAEPVATSLNGGTLTKGNDPKPAMQKEENPVRTTR